MTVSDTISGDIANPSYGDLFYLATLRTWSAAHGQLESLPKTFPNAQTTYGNSFTPEDKMQYGSLDSEDQRMDYTLSCFPERRLPAASGRTLRNLLNCSNILQSWPTVLPELIIHAEISKTNVVQAMQLASRRSRKSKRDFIAMPIDFKTAQKRPDLAHQLWQRASTELAEQLASGRDANILEFLGIHAYLRDPIGGLSRSFARQAVLFQALLKAVRTLEGSTQVSASGLRHMATQAAQESALLAVPYLEHVTHIHFHGNQQLSYVYVPLQRLSRSEFSKPKHVLSIVREILQSSSDGGLCPIVPVMIATYPNLLGSNNSSDNNSSNRKTSTDDLTIIIDGNHRVTATMLLRLLALKPKATGNLAEAKTALHHFCDEHQLGAKWRMDLGDVLDALFSPSGQLCLEILERMRPLVRRFADVNDIPALVVQEESFHTVSAQRTPSPPPPPPVDVNADAEDADSDSSAPSSVRPRLLQPVHQAIFNDEALGFAFPNAGQVHGRTAGYKTLPLIPFTAKTSRR